MTGPSDQVSLALAARAKPVTELDLTCLARTRFDLQTPGANADEIIRLSPDVVLSVAACTDVDLAEHEPDKAMIINGQAPGVLANAAADLDILIAHQSIDYVFAGTGNRPFVETDVIMPSRQYGRSKLQCEQVIAQANPKHIILRTAWVFSPFSGNFIKTMLCLTHEQKELSVVDDQVGNPTSAFDVADAIIRVLHMTKAGSSSKALWNVPHCGLRRGQLVWYCF